MFSWLFGGGDGKGNNDNNNGSNGNNAANSTSATLDVLSSGVDDKPLPQVSGSQAFDPNILERIAKAARELADKPNAQEIIDLARMQEKSWQDKFAAVRAEAEAKKKQAEADNIRVAHEERRKTIEEETRHQQARVNYEDRVARERAAQERQNQQQMYEQQLQAHEGSVARQEQEKRRTMEYQESLRRDTEIERTRIEMKMRGEQERENKDIRLEQLIAQAKENRETVIEGIKVAGTTIGEGFYNFVTDPVKVTSTVGVITGIALGVYFAKSGTSLATQYLSNRLGRPPLVRDTSRKSFLLHPIKSLRTMMTSSKGDPLEGVILKPKLQKHLQSVTIATAHTRRHKANYRHLMLHGPPGTGKTMFAKRLAQQSGLDYAILAGGDVGPLGKAAVTEIHRVFDWAEASKKGVLLFVDEADSFLRKRGEHGTDMSEDHRNALSTFLYRTGTPTNRFMLVFATNEPAAFDRAITDRVDEVVEFELPAQAEREQLLDKYFKEYVVQGGGSSAKPIRVDESVDTSSWSALAKKLEGFSGRSVAKLCGAWQAAAYASVDNALTADMMREITEMHIAQHQRKETWEATATA